MRFHIHCLYVRFNERELLYLMFNWLTTNPDGWAAVSRIRITKRNLLSTLLVIKIYWNFIHITLCKGVASTPFTRFTPATLPMNHRNVRIFVENYIAVKLLFHNIWMCAPVWVWGLIGNVYKLKLFASIEIRNIKWVFCEHSLYIELSIFYGLMALFHVSYVHFIPFTL